MTTPDQPDAAKAASARPFVTIRTTYVAADGSIGYTDCTVSGSSAHHDLYDAVQLVKQALLGSGYDPEEVQEMIND